MHVTEQVDAMTSMAVNPLRYLVGPRFIAGTLMLPLLVVFSMMMGMLGAYIISIYYFGMSPSSFLDPIPIHVTSHDIWVGIIKSFVFGALIATISCYKGLGTRGGAAGVGRYTTNSVVICYSAILVTNFLLTVALNSLEMI